MPGPEPEVFANEIGGNPRVWETREGYRLTYRYQPGRLARMQEWSLRAGLGTAGLVLAEVATPFLPWPLQTPLIWGTAGTLAGLWLARTIELFIKPILTLQLHMIFDQSSIRWFGQDVPGGQVACSAENRPSPHVVRDEVELLRLRRSISKNKRRGEPDNAMKIVIREGAYGLTEQTVLTIMAADPLEQTTRLVSVVQFLIDCMGERVMETDDAG